jgi:hypothetical protein
MVAGPGRARAASLTRDYTLDEYRRASAQQPTAICCLSARTARRSSIRREPQMGTDPLAVVDPVARARIAGLRVITN